MTHDDCLQIEAIRSLRYQYSQRADSGRLGELADLFTADARCDLGPAYGGAWQGREQIRQGFLGFAALATTPYGVLHVVTNPQIELQDAHHARGRWYLQNLLTAAGTEQPLLGLGVYEDSYVRENDGWRFASMTLHMLWPQRHAEALERSARPAP